jgi:hypothetical protein
MDSGSFPCFETLLLCKMGDAANSGEFGEGLFLDPNKPCWHNNINVEACSLLSSKWQDELYLLDNYFNLLLGCAQFLTVAL